MKHGLILNLSEYPLSARPPGPYRIAHFLRENGFDIEVIEYAVFWSLEELKELARSRITNDTVFIGSSHLFYAWSESIGEFFRWIKENYPCISIISGSTANPGPYSKYIDYYVRGYGEYAIIELLKYIASNGSEPIFNLNHLINGKKVIDAIHSYPAYPMKSLMIKYENRDFIREDEWLGIEFSRGCKFKCAFCNYPILGIKGDYTRDAEDAYIQLKDAHDRFGVSKYIIADDTLNDRLEKLTKFANVTDRLDFDPWYWSFIRADLLSSRTQDKEELLRMGVNGHYYGIESFNRSSAKSIGKGMDPEKIKDGILKNKTYFEKYSNNPFRATIGLIIGLPYETFDTLESTKCWLIDNWQGQSFVSWALEIWNNETEIPSILSNDYEKYGYTKITDNDSIKAARLITPEKYQPLGDRFYWKNEYMDFIQANQYAFNMQETLYEKYDFRPLSSDLYRFELSNPHMSFKEICNKPKRSLSTDFDDKKFIQEYINKKLSL